MSDVRWEGLTHAEIYRRVQAGPGRGASVAVESAWTDTESVIVGIEERLVSAIVQAGGGWEGTAAEATRAGVSPLGRWAADAAGDAKLTAAGVTGQGEQAAWLRSAMPSPTAPLWDEPAGRPAIDPLYMLDDIQALEQRSANDAEQAVHLMNTYTSNSYNNISAMDYWTRPPAVTVDTGSGAAVTGPAAIGPAALGPGSVGPGGARPGRARCRTDRDARFTRIKLGPDPTSPAPASREPAAPEPAAPEPADPEPVGLDPVGPDPVGNGPGGNGSVPVIPPGPAGRAPTQTPSTTTDRRPPASGNLPPGASTTTPAPGRPPLGSPAGTVPPARPGPPPSWRDLVPTTDAHTPGNGSWPRGLAEPPGAPGRGASTGLPPAEPEPSVRGNGSRANPLPASGLYPPMMGVGATSPDRDHRRPDYLLDDGDAFADDRWFPPPVIGADDLIPPRHR